MPPPSSPPPPLPLPPGAAASSVMLFGRGDPENESIVGDALVPAATGEGEGDGEPIGDIGPGTPPGTVSAAEDAGRFISARLNVSAAISRFMIALVTASFD